VLPKSLILVFKACFVLILGNIFFINCQAIDSELINNLLMISNYREGQIGQEHLTFLSNTLSDNSEINLDLMSIFASFIRNRQDFPKLLYSELGSVMLGILKNMFSKNISISVNLIKTYSDELYSKAQSEGSRFLTTSDDTSENMPVPGGDYGLVKKFNGQLYWYPPSAKLTEKDLAFDSKWWLNSFPENMRLELSSIQSSEEMKTLINRIDDESDSKKKVINLLKLLELVNKDIFFENKNIQFDGSKKPVGQMLIDVVNYILWSTSQLSSASDTDLLLLRKNILSSVFSKFLDGNTRGLLVDGKAGDIDNFQQIVKVFKDPKDNSAKILEALTTSLDELIRYVVFKNNNKSTDTINSIFTDSDKFQKIMNEVINFDPFNKKFKSINGFIFKYSDFLNLAMWSSSDKSLNKDILEKLNSVENKIGKCSEIGNVLKSELIANSFDYIRMLSNKNKNKKQVYLSAIDSFIEKINSRFKWKAGLLIDEDPQKIGSIFLAEASKKLGWGILRTDWTDPQNYLALLKLYDYLTDKKLLDFTTFANERGNLEWKSFDEFRAECEKRSKKSVRAKFDTPLDQVALIKKYNQEIGNLMACNRVSSLQKIANNFSHDKNQELFKKTLFWLKA
jgi:hypothetical protein